VSEEKCVVECRRKSVHRGRERIIYPCSAGHRGPSVEVLYQKVMSG
jgi:hypothetical protein